MKKKLVLMVMTVAMAVTFCAGCGKEKVVEEIAADDSPSANTSKVKNNGNYFIEIDNKIYFRAYPIGTLEDPLAGEDFIIGSMGEQTDVMMKHRALLSGHILRKVMRRLNFGVMENISMTLKKAF